jgi:hypothetical protein
MSTHSAECVFQVFAMPYYGHNARKLDMSRMYYNDFRTYLSIKKGGRSGQSHYLYYVSHSVDFSASLVT